MTTSKKKAFMEKRKHERVACKIRASCAVLDENYETVVSNISSGGVNVGGNHNLNVGQEIMMTMFVPEKESSTKVIGEVVWVESHGMGVRFRVGFDTSILNLPDNEI